MGYIQKNANKKKITSLNLNLYKQEDDEATKIYTHTQKKFESCEL